MYSPTHQWMHHCMAERIHHARHIESIHVCNSRRERILYCSARRHEGCHSRSKSRDLCTNGFGNHISDQYHDRISAVYASDRFDAWIKKGMPHLVVCLGNEYYHLSRDDQSLGRNMWTAFAYHIINAIGEIASIKYQRRSIILGM